MKGAVPSVELGRALALCASVVERRNTTPIIGNVRLSLDLPGSLVLTVTDLNCELQVTLEAEVTEPGQITVPAHLLSEAIRALPNGKVEIAMDMAAARFALGAAQFDLPVLPVTDFPTFQVRDGWSVAAIPASSLRVAVEHVLPCVSRDNGGRDHLLGGVYFHVVNGSFRCAACDRHRAAFAEIGPEPSLDGVRAIVPAKSVAVLLRLLEGMGEVQIGFTDTSMRLVAGRAVFLSRLVCGDYPDYQRIIPSEYDRELSVHRTCLLSAARRVSLISDEKSPGVKVDIKHGGADISARRYSEFGTATDHVEGNLAGGAVVFRLNSKYLSDALGSYDSERVAVRSFGPAHVVGFYDPDDAGRGVVIGTLRA